MLQKLKDIFTDPLFYWICLDYFLTLLIVYYWFGIEINPVVLTIWFTPAFIISLLLYLFYIPKFIPDDVILWSFDKWVLIYEIRFILLLYYIYLNIHHLFILLWY